MHEFLSVGFVNACVILNSVRKFIDIVPQKILYNIRYKNLMLASVDLLLSESSDDISEKSSSDIKAATVSYRYMQNVNLNRANLCNILGIIL